jgi:hypothetical protein
MNIGNMMRQMQDMQAKMAKMQEGLGALSIEGQAGGGMVTATINGKGEMKGIKIDPKLVDPNEKDMLEDLIVAACNDAHNKMESEIAKETEKMMGGIKLPPGVKLPF